MSEETKDEKAAMAEFLEILKAEHKKIPKEIDELMMQFHKGFREGYKWCRTILSKVYVGGYSKEVVRIFAVADNYVNYYKEIILKEDKDQKEAMNTLGRAFATFFAAVNIGIASNNFNTSTTYTKPIFEYTQHIVKTIKEINKPLRLDFIKKEVRKIARKHKNLTKEKMELIAKIASMFV